MKRAYVILAGLLCITAASALSIGVNAVEKQTTGCMNSDPFCYRNQFSGVFEKLDSVAVPKIATPAWLVAAQTSLPVVAPATIVTYTIATKGSITTDPNEFAAQVNETLNSPSGWSRLGVRFDRVETGGRFVVWLSEPSQMATFSTGCDATLSCRTGNNIVINEARWLNGADPWNAAGGSLRDYRHYVVNHEVGHWLGHGHRNCGGAGQQAPIMQQQSVSMQGCTTNTWPLTAEMYSPTLGIRS